MKRKCETLFAVDLCVNRIEGLAENARRRMEVCITLSYSSEVHLPNSLEKVHRKHQIQPQRVCSSAVTLLLPSRTLEGSFALKGARACTVGRRKQVGHRERLGTRLFLSQPGRAIHAQLLPISPPPLPPELKVTMDHSPRPRLECCADSRPKTEMFELRPRSRILVRSEAVPLCPARVARPPTVLAKSCQPIPFQSKSLRLIPGLLPGISLRVDPTSFHINGEYEDRYRHEEHEDEEEESVSDVSGRICYDTDNQRTEEGGRPVGGCERVRSESCCQTGDAKMRSLVRDTVKAKELRFMPRRDEFGEACPSVTLKSSVDRAWEMRSERERSAKPARQTMPA